MAIKKKRKNKHSLSAFAKSIECLRGFYEAGKVTGKTGLVEFSNFSDNDVFWPAGREATATRGYRYNETFDLQSM